MNQEFTSSSSNLGFQTSVLFVSHNIIRAKHEEHASICCCWSCGIWCPREKHIHRTLIISVSPSSTHPFLTSVSRWFVVQKMGVSPSKFPSKVKWLFGAERWTTWPSNMSKKSCQAMICGDQRQSFKKITSAFSATQAKLEVHDWWTCCKSYSEDLRRRSSHNSLGRKHDVTVLWPTFL